MNSDQLAPPRVLLDSRIAVRKDRPSITIAPSSTTTATHHQRPSSSSFGLTLVDLVRLVVRLVEREQAADA